MYLRHKKVRGKDGVTRYWTLVRSVRRGSKVVQETVANLGKLDEEAVREATALSRHFLGPKADQPGLFEDSRPLSTANVRLGKVRVERCRAFGAVWLSWTLWRALELDEFCERALPKGRERVPWAEVAAILVIARLCEPSSELHIAEDFYRRTALDDLLGVAPELVHHTRLYQGLDKLLEHKDELEMHIKERLGGLFALDYDLLLYDVTSTYFEGEANGNGMAKRGYSRDGRPDCKQVCIGLVVSRAGLGNSPRTLLEELGRIQVVDVVIPVVGGPELRLRCVAQPDGAQAALLQRLGLTLPKRLRPCGVPQM